MEGLCAAAAEEEEILRRSFGRRLSGFSTYSRGPVPSSLSSSSLAGARSSAADAGGLSELVEEPTRGARGKPGSPDARVLERRPREDEKLISGRRGALLLREHDKDFFVAVRSEETEEARGKTLEVEGGNDRRNFGEGAERE